MNTRRTLTLALLIALLAPVQALACGGFFCFQQPIDQSAERVLYVKQADKITVHIQISYTGEDEKFSWVLPLLSVPQLGIGSDSVFQLLEQGTSPFFQVDWKNTSECQAQVYCAMADGGGGPPSGGGEGGGGVDVLLQETVGPYDAVVVKSKNADELLKWLNDNGYIQPKETKPLVESYVKQGHVFLALKLQKDKSAGDIQPIVVTLDEPSPCLPIRLTSIAAKPDMPIVTWMLAAHRAIPKNYLHVVLNDATIDWMTGGGNYKTVVSKAVDQASGHAFTTEYAQPVKSFGAKFHDPKWNTKLLEGIKEPGKFMSALLEYGYPRTSQMQTLIRKYIPKPAQWQQVADNEFYNCLTCQGCNEKPCADYKADVAKQAFDSAAFAKEIDEFIVMPLKEVQDAFDSLAYLTRLYTTLDPSEMDKDPIFAFNADLPDVARTRTATAYPICEAGKKTALKAKLVFANGHELTIDLPENYDNCMFGGGGAAVGFGKGSGPVNTDGGQPAWRVEVLDESGPPLIIDPSAADKVDAALNNVELGKPSLTQDFIDGLPAVTWNPTSKDDPNGGKPAEVDAGGAPGTDAGNTAPDATTTPTNPGASVPAPSSSCSASPVSPVAPLATLLLLGLGVAFLLRRRVRVRR